MKKIPMLERFAAQSLVEHDGELIFSKERFAELIVRECIEIVEPCKCGCCDGEPEGYITDTIIKQIREHFGVEK